MSRGPMTEAANTPADTSEDVHLPAVGEWHGNYLPH